MISRAASLLLWSAVSALAQNVHSMTVLESRYQVRAGEPATLSVPVETLDFLLNAKTRSVSVQGPDTTGLVVAPNVTRDQIVLAPSLRAKPGAYTVTVSATNDTGEERQTSLDVVVKPRVTVPNGSARAPVVLLNGWQTGFYGSCPVATTSATTFGNLAQYLVADGVPVVYLFDNCVEDPNQSIEVLGSDLGQFLNSIKYDSGDQVPQIDLVAFSMGGLIARAYLSGIQPNQSYLPPSPSLVGKLVLVATPNFGSFLAGNFATSLGTGTQSSELVPGSAFLWNLATWNQHGDDLRGVNTIAVVGNAGTFTSSLSSGTQLAGASDGLVSVTSAAVGFAVAQAVRTRVVPYCHIDPATFINSAFGTFNCNAPGIANVTSTGHPTGQIVRSFLAGGSDWSAVGHAPSADQYLSANGGMFFAMAIAAGGYATDMTSVVWGNTSLQNGGAAGTIFYTDLIAGTGSFAATSQSLGAINCGSLTQAVGYSWALRCKLGAGVFSVTPLAGTSGWLLAAGSTVTINGVRLGTQCNGCQVLAYPQGSSTPQTLSVSSWQNQSISVKLPADQTGLLTLKVLAAGGTDTIGVMVAAASTIAVPSTSLSFAATLGGPDPAAQPVDISNSGTGTLSWTATASDPWLTVSPSSGTAPSTLSVSVSSAGLGSGTYTGTVQISSTGASNTPVKISVTFTISAAPPALAISPATLSFQGSLGGAAPAPQDLSISNSGSGTLNWTASADSSWIGLSVSSGTAPGTLSVSINPAGLAAGVYHGTVTVTPADSSIASFSIPVTLTLQ